MGTSTRAVPRSGCLRIKASGTPTSNSGFQTHRADPARLIALRKEARQYDDYNNLPVLTPESLGQRGDPAFCAEASAAEY